MSIDELIATVAPVRSLKSGRAIASASGFFYVHSDDLYFVTNRHVLVDEDEDYYPDSIELRVHTDTADVRKNADYTVSLYDSKGQPLWHEHPKGGREIDVVAIPLDKRGVTSRFFVKAFSPQDSIPSDVRIGIGEDVLVIGYPLGFYDRIHNLPIVRGAILASIYPVPFEGKPYVLIDSRLHSGTSGSPVLTKPSHMIQRGDATNLMAQPISYLVGVHSATLEVQDRDPTLDEPLGLNVVWFESLIQEIIAR